MVHIFHSIELGLGYYTFFTYLLFGTETMVLPINHPMVIDISPAVRMFNNRFLPQLLTYPNPDDPLNIESAELLLNNPDGFKIKVKEYIDKYCYSKK